MVRSFTKEVLVKGRPLGMKCLEIGQQTYCLSRGPATVAHLEDEWYDDVEDPGTVITALKESRATADIFTFWQRFPDIKPRFDYYMEPESIAVLPVRGFEYWWNEQIRFKTRNHIRKAAKCGVETREVHFDDAFVRGMTEIFNETPVRQGRRFWHYGKDFETVKRQFSRYLFREELIGAYYRDELIGFVMLGNAGRYAVVGQILSKLEHRDKATNNALMAKAVEVCARKGFPYLVYVQWGSPSLADFKRQSGFEETRVPRYYVPLTAKGRLILRLGLHRGWMEIVPFSIKTRMKALRSRWLGMVDDRRRTGGNGGTDQSTACALGARRRPSDAVYPRDAE
jgi:hypothetical protein